MQHTSTLGNTSTTHGYSNTPLPYLIDANEWTLAFERQAGVYRQGHVHGRLEQRISRIVQRHISCSGVGDGAPPLPAAGDELPMGKPLGGI